MRPIDADVAIKNLKEWLNQTGIIPKDTSYYWELLGCIEDTPVVEFPPAVRCKDCKYREYECSIVGRHNDDFYCADGKKKDGQK